MIILIFIANIIQKISSTWSYANCYNIAKNDYPCRPDWLGKRECSGRALGEGWWDHLPCSKCPFYRTKGD